MYLLNIKTSNLSKEAIARLKLQGTVSLNLSGQQINKSRLTSQNSDIKHRLTLQGQFCSNNQNQN